MNSVLRPAAGPRRQQKSSRQAQTVVNHYAIGDMFSRGSPSRS